MERITNVSVLIIILCVVLFSLGCLTQTVWADETDRLGLEKFEEGGGSPWVTGNRALNKLDALVLPVVDVYPADASPVVNSATDGSVFIVPDGGEGDWSGKDDQIAIVTDSVLGFYDFIEPATGWAFYVQSGTAEGSVLFYDGQDWGPKQRTWTRGLLLSESRSGFSQFAAQDRIVQEATPSTAFTVMHLVRNLESGDNYYVFTVNDSGPSLELYNGDGANVDVRLTTRGDSFIKGTEVSFGDNHSADEVLDVSGVINLRERYTSPLDPDEGAGKIWLDTAGNFRFLSNPSGTVKEATVEPN